MRVRGEEKKREGERKWRGVEKAGKYRPCEPGKVEKKTSV